MTTTDPFTQAALAEAEARVRAVNGTVLPLRDDFRDGYLYGFERGARWARDHLAAQEPTDAEIEAAAIECVKFLFLTAPERPWEDPEVVEQWEPMARIALRSARAARRDEEKR